MMQLKSCNVINVQQKRQKSRKMAIIVIFQHLKFSLYQLHGYGIFYNFKIRLNLSNFIRYIEKIKKKSISKDFVKEF